MRGTESVCSMEDCRTGITPAHAGNSPRADCPCLHQRDHPRSCGEQPIYPANYRVDIGSPPLMRGTGETYAISCMYQGITPAHAGNSKFDDVKTVDWEDHPRSCGEQQRHLRDAGKVGGSPPLMRGTDMKERSTMDDLRITPAHAGNSSVVNFGILAFEDHPRSCGEQPHLGACVVFI